MGAGEHRPGPLHGPRAGVVLRGHGVEPQRARHAAAEHLPAGADQHPLGVGRLQPRVRERPRRRTARRSQHLRARQPRLEPGTQPARRRAGRRHPGTRVRRLHDDVRRHHAGARHRGDGGSPEVRRLRSLPRDLVRDRLRTGRPLALEPGRLAHDARRAGLGGRTRGARLRRRSRPRPAARHRSTATLAERRDTSPLHPARRARCGDPLVRVVRLQRSRRPAGKRHCSPGAHQHPTGCRRGDAGLALHRTPQRGPCHRARRRHGSRRGPGDDHAVRGLRHELLRDHHRCARRARLPPGAAPQGQRPPRRRTRRDRRALHRRRLRLTAARTVREQRGQLDRRRRPLLRRRPRPARLAGARRRRRRGVLVRPHLADRNGRREDHRATRPGRDRRRARLHATGDVGIRDGPQRGRHAGNPRGERTRRANGSADRRDEARDGARRPRRCRRIARGADRCGRSRDRALGGESLRR